MLAAPLLALEALRLFGAGFFYFAHATLAALGALSPLEASLALTLRLLAEPLFALYGGHLADRWPRGRLLLLAASGQGGLTLALLPLLGAPSPLPLYLLGFLFALLEALRMVAAGALLADLLPKEALAQARGKLGALYTTADTLSDLFAGLLFTRSRPWTVGLGSGLLFLAAGLYRTLPLPPRPPGRPEGGSLSGLRFLWQSPLRPLLILEALLNVAYALFAGLLPFLVLRGLGEAPWALGLLGAAQSLGGALGGLLVGAVLGRLGEGRTLRLALGLAGLGLLGGALLPPWPLLAGSAFLLGAGGALFGAVAGAIRLGEAPPELRGRVAGGFLFLSGALAPLGPLLGGALAGVALPLPFLLAGGLLLGLAPLWRRGRAA
ncbi:MFS transporter [Thermus scotoductus]|uniref:MFS transporter n=2 Tax=Thermus scotoductus TaxID=37636 RepID=A0A430R5F8_THESC|nr:MFS transporter [Thermus scotoductus]RTH02608.1 MFS transporter [Thermus scotoductus]RTH99522.1 MFS transporter [Thermus scotoductus]RTI16077.1 MFS transporter [Thermus scotoductus]